MVTIEDILPLGDDTNCVNEKSLEVGGRTMSWVGSEKDLTLKQSSCRSNGILMFSGSSFSPSELSMKSKVLSVFSHYRLFGES